LAQLNSAQATLESGKCNMTFTLYNAPQSTCSQRVRFVLNAKKLPFSEVKRTVLGDVDVADVLLSHAADSGADFMIMGGYGHSRLREFVLGGVTRSIFRTMTVPVLMSH